jgi:hypothetical protein
VTAVTDVVLLAHVGAPMVAKIGALLVGFFLVVSKTPHTRNMLDFLKSGRVLGRMWSEHLGVLQVM